MGVVIHCEPKVAWQGPFAHKIQTGLANIGIDARITDERGRCDDIAILLGTTFWRGIEGTGRYLLVDRCSFGDTNQYVSLVWDGHGRRGDHCVPDNPRGRWKVHGVEVKTWTMRGTKRVLCGQTETYSPHYSTPEQWYAEVPEATHFRKHPAGCNPTGLPAVTDWDDCEVAITLNSSVAVDAVINGIPVITMDEGAMAWPVSSHWSHVHKIYNRKPWLEWLAWTQWHHDEIEAGEPIKHLFEAI